MVARAGTGGGAVFLLSDYGTADEFAGLLRAVVARLAPDAPLVDLTHDVPAFDVRAGALTLVRAVPHLGFGVVLAVVDPGVGTARRAVACTVRPRDAAAPGPSALVGPDNGLLVWAADALGGIDEVVALAKPAGASSTFDGRDVFAPAAAALWRGEPPASLGEPLSPDELVRLPLPRVERSPGRVEAEVQWVDRFGNAQLAATADDGRASGILEAPLLELGIGDATCRARVVGAFGELGPGEPGVLVDANGHLAIVCNERAAATVLGVQAGDTVTLRRPAADAPGTSPDTRGAP